jgi:hypothetical protein
VGAASSRDKDLEVTSIDDDELDPRKLAGRRKAVPGYSRTDSRSSTATRRHGEDDETDSEDDRTLRGGLDPYGVGYDHLPSNPRELARLSRRDRVAADAWMTHER